jgi:predicted nucleotide-binding protein
MLDSLEQSVLLAIRRLTADTYQPTDGQAVADELERQGCRPEDDMALNHLLRRLKDDGYISPKAYFGSEGLKAIVSVDLTVQGRETADQNDQPQVPSDAGSTGSDQTSAPDPAKVMVVHGRDEESRQAMFGFLRALGLVPLEWSDLVAATGSAAPYVGQVLTKAFEIAKAVVVLFTPDDEGWLKEEFRQPDEPPEETQPTPQARANVLFEAGMALGVHPDRTVLVELGKLRSFSDIYGRHVIRLNGTDEPFREIARRLDCRLRGRRKQNRLERCPIPRS